MHFDILTIFPNIFNSYFKEGIIKRAKDKKLISIKTHDIRKYSKDKHKRVDDMPFGGGAGMLMTPQPLYDAITQLKKKNKGPVVFLSPQGKLWSQSKAESFSTKYKEMIILCGRYEGIDQRIRDTLIDQEISIGNYVLTGGEIAAMVLVDSISRLIPGVIGAEESHLEDSFSKSLNRKKEYPHYTRPAKFKGMKVPEVLLSGHHKKIENWRKKNLK